MAACIEDGGNEFCRKPLANDWSIGWCDDYSEFPFVARARCVATGGTFNGIYGDPPCVGGKPTTEANLISVANIYEKEMTQDASCHIVGDSGWGQTYDNYRCGSGSPRYQNGILVGDGRVLSPNCGAGIYVDRSRGFHCPTGYDLQTLANNDLVCKRPQECCKTGRTAFPITFGTGLKVLNQTDYHAADGVEFTRYYNSLYFFVPRAAQGDELRDMGMNWTTNYSKRLYPITDSQFVTAAVVDPATNVQYFDATGNEVVRYGGAKSHLAVTGQGYELRKSDGSIESYDSTGVLRSVTSLSGMSQTLIYTDGTDGTQTGLGGFYLDSNGNPTTYVMRAGMLLRVIDTLGRALNFAYDASNRIAQVQTPGGGVLKYQYDDYGNLVQATQSDGTHQNYIYNEQSYTGNTNLPNALTGILDEDGVRLMTYYYDSTGRAVREISPSEGTNTNLYQLTFDANAFTTTVVDPLGAARTYQYQLTTSGIPQLVSETRQSVSGSGTVHSDRTYDASGNVATKTDFNGNVTTYAYDARNLEISRTEADGTPQARTTLTQWHTTLGKPVLITESDRTTAYTYDSNGNQLTKTVTDTTTNMSRTWTYTYNNLGQILTADGPRTDVNDVTTYTYYTCDHGYECGQIHTVTNAAGHQTTYLTYNANGQPLTISDPNGVVTTLTYDARQRLSSRTIGTEATVFEYWPTGTLKRTTLPDGSNLAYTYDDAHRLQTITDGQGNSIHYTLDAAGNRTHEETYDPSNALAFTKTQIFNSLGRLSEVIGAANQSTAYSYDDDGNVLSVTDPNGYATQNTYDPLNRLSSVLDAASGLTQYGYNVHDDLTSVTDPRSLTTMYTFNALGDQAQLASPDTGTSDFLYDDTGAISQSTDARSQSALYTYDAIGRVTDIAYSDDALHFSYDQGANAVGRLTQATDGATSIQWSYDSVGRVQSKQQTVGAKTFAVGYQYNAAGQLETLTTPSGQMIGYTYDNGRISGITLNGTPVLNGVLYAPFGATRGWQWGNGALTVREYDQDGQLTTIDSAGASTYTFNPDGTIASRQDDSFVAPNVETGTTAVAVDTTSNRINSTSGTLNRLYSYDGSGNTTSNGANAFTYGGSGRMMSVTTSNGTTQYSYNALGQRAKKSGMSGATYFVYDEGGHLLGEYDSNGDRIQELVWFGDIPVASIRADQTGGTGMFYIHTDHLNAPMKLTRTTDNVVVWRWDHDPYGNGDPDEDPDGNGMVLRFNLRFPGQYYDLESGLNYNYFRDYDSATGRYAESDPIGISGGINGYAYVKGHALSSFDKNGLQEESERERDEEEVEEEFFGPRLVEPRPRFLEPWGEVYFDTPNSCGLCMRVWFVARVRGVERPEDRDEANRQFYESLEGPNAPLNAPAMQRAMRGPFGLRNPTGMEWHHPVNRPNEVWLISRCDHLNEQLQEYLHPNGLGGIGQRNRK